MYVTDIKEEQVLQSQWRLKTNSTNVLQDFVWTLGLLFAGFIAVEKIGQGGRPVGSFVILVTYWTQLSGSLSYFAGIYAQVLHQLSDAGALAKIFQAEPEIVEDPQAIDLPEAPGSIVFKNVCFTYPPKGKKEAGCQAVRGVSFIVKPGQMVGIVGVSGSGKSTIVKLLLGILKAGKGEIKIGGVNIEDIKQSSLRRFVRIVFQVSQRARYRDFRADHR